MLIKVKFSFLTHCTIFKLGVSLLHTHVKQKMFRIKHKLKISKINDN